MIEFELTAFILFTVLALIFVLLNGFFVAAEFALVGVRRSSIEDLAQKGVGRAKVVLKALDHQDHIISATQLGITMASLALGFVAGSYFEPVIEHMFDDFLPNLAIGISVGAVVALAATTYAHVVLGELVFKSVALQYPEGTSLWVARPLSWFSTIASPVIKLFNGTAWLILAVFGVKPVPGAHVHSEDELKLLITQSQQAGILDESETVILSRAFDLADTSIREIMTPRTELVSIDVEEDFHTILKKVIKTGHSRFPVHEESPDNVVGFLYAKDLLSYLDLLLENHLEGPLEPNLRNILREPDFVPEIMKADKLLEKFQNSKRQVAIVLNEFGGVVGLISLEDVLELLVGDIQDEYDSEPIDIVRSENGELVSGQTSLDDFNDYFKTSLASEHSVTIGGLITEKIGRFPEEEESVVIENYRIQVKKLENRRIQTLLINQVVLETDVGDSEEHSKNNGKNGKNESTNGI